MPEKFHKSRKAVVRLAVLASDSTDNRRLIEAIADHAMGVLASAKGYTLVKVALETNCAYGRPNIEAHAEDFAI